MLSFQTDSVPAEIGAEVLSGAREGGARREVMRLGRIFCNVLSTDRLMMVPVVFRKSDVRSIFEKS